MSTQGSGYATTTFIPSSVDCEQFKLAARGESQEDANERIDSLNVSDQALETASNSLHTADYNTSTTLTNVATIVVKIIGALAGIAIVGSLVVAGAQYATAGDNSGAITKAKTRIAYTLIALVIYIMVYYVAVWLIPS